MFNNKCIQHKQKFAKFYWKKFNFLPQISSLNHALNMRTHTTIADGFVMKYLRGQLHEFRDAKPVPGSKTILFMFLMFSAETTYLTESLKTQE